VRRSHKNALSPARLDRGGAFVTQGTFYIYFHSKLEIFVELVNDLGKGLRAATRAVMAGAPDRLEAEWRAFAAFFELAANHRRIYTIVREAERVAPEQEKPPHLPDDIFTSVMELIMHGLAPDSKE
jgi:AcrR family transcriptional regulator